MPLSLTPTTSTTFASLVGQVIGYIDSIVWILGSVAVIFFLWGVLRYIARSGAKQDRKFMLWSLLALFILFSVWGILRVMCSSFGVICTGSNSEGTIGGTSNGSPAPNGNAIY